MPRWTRNNRTRRAYLKPYNVTTLPRNTGVHKEGMAISNASRFVNPDHKMAFIDEDGMHSLFAFKHEVHFNLIMRTMEARARLRLEQRHARLNIKDKLMWVVLQSGKHFKLVLFWGSSSFFFMKYEDLKGSVTVSKPYPRRDEAMDDYDRRNIQWIEVIPLPTQS